MGDLGAEVAGALQTEKVAKRRRGQPSTDNGDDAHPGLRPRPQRQKTDLTKVKLTLSDFPPGSKVFTPRRGEAGGGSWCVVIRHDDGQLRVAVPGETSALVSLDYLARRQATGAPIQMS